jgi:hypothetical protein
MGRYTTIPTTQDELDNVIKKTLKKNCADILEIELINALKEENHELWLRTALQIFIRNKILYIERIEDKNSNDNDYFCSGFHSLLNNKLSFYAYKFLANGGLKRPKDFHWLHLIFFRTTRNQLMYYIVRHGYVTNKIYKDFSRGLLYDEIMSEFRLIDNIERPYISFTERRNLRQSGKIKDEFYSKKDILEK